MSAERSTSGRMTAVTVSLIVVVTASMLVPARANSATAGTWTVGGPYGGYVRSVAVSPHDSNLVLTATTEGLFRSINGAGSWNPASAGLGTVDTAEVVFDVQDPTVAWAATSDGVFRSADGGSSWRSTGGHRAHDLESTTSAVFAGSSYQLQVRRDGDTTWTTIYNPGSEAAISDWTVAPSNPRVIYLSTGVHADQSAHLYRSGDGGATWQETSLRGARDLVVDVKDPKVVYATTGGAVVRSNDSGATWTTIREEAGWPYAHDVAVSETNPSIVLVADVSGYGGRVVHRTTDGGATWKSTRVLGLQQGPELEIDPTNPQVVFYGGRGDGIYRSLDGAGTFHYANTGLTAGSAAAVATDPTDASVLYTALDRAGGLFRSPDAGRTWQHISDGLREDSDPDQLPEFTSLAVAADGDLFVARHLMTMGGYTIMGSSNGGLAWQRRDEGLPSGMIPDFVVAHPTDPNLLLATLHDYGVTNDRLIGKTFRSTDGGATWTDVPDLPVVVESIAVDPITAQVTISTGDTRDSSTEDDRLYTSTDFGQSWERLTYPKSLQFVDAVAFDSRTDRFYVGSGRNSKVARSDDGGESWTTGDLGVIGVTALAVDPLDPTQVIAGTQYNGTWISRDGGQSWGPLNNAHGMTVKAVTFAQPPPPPTASFAAATTTAATTTSMSYGPAFVGMRSRSKSGLARMIPRPHNRLLPAVTGTPRIGRRLACDPGRWTRAGSFAYRWFRGEARIAGATSSSYVIVRADKGRRLRCLVTARGPGGTDKATSRPVNVP